MDILVTMNSIDRDEDKGLRLPQTGLVGQQGSRSRRENLENCMLIGLMIIIILALVAVFWIMGTVPAL